MLENSFLLSILGFLIILTPLVFVHELGHYVAAIKNRVNVEIFSIGFGKEIFGFNDKKGTRWKFCLLPFGGYVKMQGELLVNEKNVSIKKNVGNFHNSSLLSRFMIVFSGPLANILLGIFLISILYSINGRLDNKPVVGEILKNSPAEISGLEQKDVIHKIDGVIVTNFFELQKIIKKNANRELNLIVIRNNSKLELTIRPSEFFDKKTNEIFGRIGITSGSPSLVKTGIFSSIYYSIYDTYQITKQWIIGFITLISFNAKSEDIAGPVGIAKISGDALASGFGSIIFLMALLSINLGLINLLPIPGLDGGYIMLYTLELILRRPLPETIQIKITQFGIFFLISLMIFITFWDIRKLFV